MCPGISHRGSYVRWNSDGPCSPYVSGFTGVRRVIINSLPLLSVFSWRLVASFLAIALNVIFSARLENKGDVKEKAHGNWSTDSLIEMKLCWTKVREWTNWGWTHMGEVVVIRMLCYILYVPMRSPITYMYIHCPEIVLTDIWLFQIWPSTHPENAAPDDGESGQNCRSHVCRVDEAKRDGGSEGKAQHALLHILIWDVFDSRCQRKDMQELDGNGMKRRTSK